MTTSTDTFTALLADRKDLSQMKEAHGVRPSADEGEVVMEIQRFGFSANNITYAALGDDMGYWRFFPTEDGWGLTPVWGHAEVVESRCPEVPVGARYFGYYPLASHLVVRPVKVTDGGFVDGAPHRAELPPVYQRYVRVAGAGEADVAQEDQEALWRPLFVTSYGAADFLKENGMFGAATLVLTSASSKTAMGIAFCMRQLDPGVELVGLTSPGNVEFTEGTGYYDRVLAYDSLSDIGNGPITVVDISGDDALLDRLTEHATDNLLKLIVLGATHWQDRERSLLNPRPGSEFFFLPTWILKRNEDWGSTRFFELAEQAWRDFAPTTESWLTIEEHVGVEQISAVYASVLAGESRPDRGYALSFG